MRVATGRILRGQVVVEGEGALPEGKRVTVMIEDDEAGFHLDEASRKELLAAMASLDRGERVSEEQMEAELAAL